MIKGGNLNKLKGGYLCNLFLYIHTTLFRSLDLLEMIAVGYFVFPQLDNV